MPVPMYTVTSTNLSYIGWEDGILYITFHSGKKYKYFDVPATKFTDMKNTSSVGKYFNNNIKGKFKEEEI